MKTALAILTIGAILLLGLSAQAQVPPTISNQGILKDDLGDNVPDDDYDFTFSVYDVPTGGTALWMEVQSVSVVDGIYNVTLGSVTPLTLIFDTDYWLGITVAPDGEMTPRHRLTSAPYAFRANTATYADSLVGGLTSDTDWVEAGGNVYRLSGKVGIGTATPEFALTLDGDGGILAKGTIGAGDTLSTSGAGTRFIWYPRKAALRAGRTNGDQWNNGNIGDSSIGLGFNPLADRIGSIALGWSPSATGDYALALGLATDAYGWRSVAIGSESSANLRAVGLGYNADAAGDGSIAIGYDVRAANTKGIAIGTGIDASNPLVNPISNSLGIGFNSTEPLLFAGGPNDRVGIGTTTPDELLDVAGTVEADGLKIPTGATDGYVLTSDAAGVGTWQAAPGGGGDDGDWTVSGDNMYSAVAGSLGIGTATPAAKLHVHTTASSSETNGVLVTNDSGTEGLGLYLDVSGNATLHQRAPNRGLSLTVGSDETLNLDYSGNVGVGVWPVHGEGRLQVYGTTKTRGLWVSVGASDGHVLTSDEVGVATWQPVDGGDSDWTISGNDMYSAVAGSVGIGTTTPEELLDVAGTAQVTGLTMPTGASDGHVLTSDASGGASWQAPSDDGDWYTVDDHIYHLDGRVGIGTIPEAGRKLDINGGEGMIGIFADGGITGTAVQATKLVIGGNVFGLLGSDEAGVQGRLVHNVFTTSGELGNADAGVQGSHSGGSFGELGSSTCGAYGRFDPPGAGWAGYFQGNGYFSDSLGIGTTAPEELLDVAGTAQVEGLRMPTGASDGYVLTSDATGEASWQATPDDGDWYTVDDHIYHLDGRVGIGTIPEAGRKLDINGGEGMIGIFADGGITGTAVQATKLVIGGNVFGLLGSDEAGVQGRLVHNVFTTSGELGNADAGVQGSHSGGSFGELGSSTCGAYGRFDPPGAGWAGYFDGRVVVSDTLGIGTDTPQARLDIAGGNWDVDNTEGDLRIGDAEDRLIIGVATTAGAAGVARLRAKGNDAQIRLGTDAGEPFIINNEKVGIGTDQPARVLHIDDLMRLEPRADFPTSPGDGDLCVVGASGSRHIYCYLNGGWRQMD